MGQKQSTEHKAIDEHDEDSISDYGIELESKYNIRGQLQEKRDSLTGLHVINNMNVKLFVFLNYSVEIKNMEIPHDIICLCDKYTPRDIECNPEMIEFYPGCDMKVIVHGGVSWTKGIMEMTHDDNTDITKLILLNDFLVQHLKLTSMSGKKVNNYKNGSRKTLILYLFGRAFLRKISYEKYPFNIQIICNGKLDFGNWSYLETFGGNIYICCEELNISSDSMFSVHKNGNIVIDVENDANIIGSCIALKGGSLRIMANNIVLGDGANIRMQGDIELIAKNRLLIFDKSEITTKQQIIMSYKQFYKGNDCKFKGNIVKTKS